MMLFVAMMVGANSIITRYMNACYARYNTLPMGTLANYTTGLATALIALWIMGEPITVQPMGAITFRTVFMFLGGAFGVGLIQLFIYITPRLPAFAATLLIFLGQLSVGLTLDYVLTGNFSFGKLIGGILVLAGLGHYAWLGKRIDIKARQSMEIVG